MHYVIDRRPQQMKHQSLDLRDVVKDSMYREARGLSHRTTMGKKAPDVANYRESHYVLAQLREANWYGDEPRELSRSKSCQYEDGFSLSISKDCRRFSYDGRETDRLSIRSGDTAKTTTPKQLKELPRLSLDSRERSIRTLSSVSLVPVKPFDSKSNLPSRNPKIDCDKGLIQTRPPSVVAKLMGLETFPDSVSTSDEKLDVGPIKSHHVEDLNSLSKSSEATDFCESINMHNSSRSSMRQPTSPCWKNPDLKPISRVPIEPAPWKQRDGTQGLQKPAPCVIRSSNKIHSPVSSVYCEVDKRLKNLEFLQSGKDLRALKQILEAMQAVEAKKSEKLNTVDRPSDHEMSLYDHQNPPSANRGSNVSRANESHIVIMKPAKLVGKGFRNDKACKDPITESTCGERQSRPSTLSDSSKPRKQSNKQQSESMSPSRRRRLSNFQQSDDQNKEISSELRKLSCNKTQSSQRLDGGRVSKMDAEVNASEYSEETNSRQNYTTQNPAEKIVTDQVGATNDRVSSPINLEKLQQVEHLVQKLKRFNSSHDEAHIDYIAYLCENTNPDDRYISELFLASGLLLRDLESFEFHSSGHPFNPDLFLVLERTKFSNLQKEKFHRKLIFDAVNVILEEKLQSACRTMQDPRNLLRELCLEIDQLQMQKKRERCGFGEDDDDDDGLKSILWEDVLKRSENWTGFHGESPVITGEVERLIFKDLINEVVAVLDRRSGDFSGKAT
ncbi:protein of unknown function DUF4378 [Cynara cardunculus var. scolymus]|uniref:DUF4378 domain-containing protein n=1 Tax=Cynara cardunculus var. scolymus TaxID=59895 RepID=A0A118JYE2_CYNCS|nr:protein of unknown function DUF4378 [Cynara cardunculus var. scolymus]